MPHATKRAIQLPILAIHISKIQGTESHLNQEGTYAGIVTAIPIARTAIRNLAFIRRLVRSPGLAGEGELDVIPLALGCHGQRILQAADHVPTILVIVIDMLKPADRRLVVVFDPNLDFVRVGTVGPNIWAPVGHVQGADAGCVRGRGSRRRVIFTRWRRNKVGWSALVPIETLRIIALEES